MPDRDLIEAYLVELDAELRLPRRARERIVAEARDHLYERLAMTGGESDRAVQTEAIDAFGTPSAVARRFGEELAIGATRRAARGGAVMFVLSLVLWDLCTSSFVHVAPGWLGDGPGSAVLWIVGQVGLVAGAISLVRARVARRHEGIDTVRLRYAVRGLLVLAVCTIITIALGAAGIVAALTMDTAARPSLAVLAALVAGCAAVTATAVSTTSRARRRLAAVQDAPLTATGRDAVIDLLTTADDGLAWTARRVPLAGAARRALRRWAPAASRALRPIDPQEHPWRFGSVVALLAGLCVPVLAIAVLAIKGQLGTSSLGSLAATSAALLTVEALFVLAGYACLGRYLGLRPSNGVVHRLASRDHAG